MVIHSDALFLVSLPWMIITSSIIKDGIALRKNDLWWVFTFNHIYFRRKEDYVFIQNLTIIYFYILYMIFFYLEKTCKMSVSAWENAGLS